MAVQQLKDGRWVVDGRPGFFPDEPNRRRMYFGKGPEAEVAARQKNDECLAIRGVAAKRPVKGPTVAELSAAYFESKNFNANSRKQLQIRLERIILPLIGHRNAIRLRDKDLDEYVKKRKEHKTKKGTPVKNSTIRREITDIKAILNWSATRRPPLIKFNPIANYTAPAADDDVILPPTPKEAAAIYRAAAAHLQRAIDLSYYTGLRPGAVELLTLTWEYSISSPWLPMPGEKVEVVRTVYQELDKVLGDEARSRTTHFGFVRIRSAHKGGPQARDVPIHFGLMKKLRLWHMEDGGSGPLIHYRGKAIKKIQTAWKWALKGAKINRRIRPYDLRHNFVTAALESGADIGALANVVGSRPETLRRVYQHVNQEHERRTVAMIPELKIDEKGAK